MLPYITLWVLTVPLIALLDLVWLGVLAKELYQERLAHLLGPVLWTPAVLFYFVYAAGIIFFAVYPGLSAGSLWKAALFGALIGLFAYGTYDLTNHATLKEWPVLITIVDMLWGTFLSGVVATCAYLIARNVLGIT